MLVKVAVHTNWLLVLTVAGSFNIVKESIHQYFFVKQVITPIECLFNIF